MNKSATYRIKKSKQTQNFAANVEDYSGARGGFRPKFLAKFSEMHGNVAVFGNFQEKHFY